VVGSIHLETRKERKWKGRKEERRERETLWYKINMGLQT
jgi:hypothetical protein